MKPLQIVNDPVMRLGGGGLRVSGAATATPWYLAGGISPANCLIAYQPKGAASLALSRINLANPGTYDATDGVAPTWDITNGWKFDSTQWLNTGVIPASGYSYIIQFSNLASWGALFGGETYSFVEIWIQTNSNVYYDNNSRLDITGNPTPTSGNLAMAGLHGFRNGVREAGTMAAWGAGGTPMSIHISGRHTAADTNVFRPGFYCQAFSIYNTTITNDQVLAVYTAMQALP